MGGPAVVGANWYRFAADEHIDHAHVMSVSFIWVLVGSGVVAWGARRFEMSARSVLRLPWGHQVSYAADRRHPFQVGTLHVVPSYDAGPVFTPRVAFLPDDPLLHAPDRRGDGGPEEAELLSATGASGRRLVSLATYAVERFTAGSLTEDVCRALGALVLDAGGMGSGGRDPAVGLPSALEQMTEFAAQHLDRPLTVHEIAAAGGCSPTTARRLFAAHTGMSVAEWVRAARMREAARLLRTTAMRTNEVARRVGFTDPLYFSRVFKAAYDVAPSHYARQQLRP